MATELCPQLRVELPDPEQGRVGDLQVTAADGWQTTVATVHRGSLTAEQVVARAHVLAAAPELLAVAEEFVRGSAGLHNGSDDRCWQCCVVAQAQAAIAKARGTEADDGN